MSQTPIITPRPDSLETETIRAKTACGDMYVTMSMNQECWEICPVLGKSGACQQAFLEALWRLLTVCRRQLNPIPRALILKCLDGIKCEQSGAFLKSCPQAICDLLREKWGLREEKEETE